jgi:hypothetical protein
VKPSVNSIFQRDSAYVEVGHDQPWEQGVICTAVLPCIIVKDELELVSDRMCDNISQYASIKELWLLDFEAFSLVLHRATLCSLIHESHFWDCGDNSKDAVWV